jgi:hypothetical protein
MGSFSWVKLARPRSFLRTGLPTPLGVQCRDSFTDTESFKSTPKGVADFNQNRWPACARLGGRLPSERVAALGRNQWPAWSRLRSECRQRSRPMPAERAPMRKIREVLRLKYACGLSERRIALAIGLSRSTIKAYLKRAESCGISWPLVARDRRCHARAVAVSTNRGGGGRCAPAS